MKAERSMRRRRVLTRYSAEDRKRLIQEQARSGQSKAAFCRRRGINLGTFHGWTKGKGAAGRSPSFSEVDVVPGAGVAAIEVLLPNGARVGIRHQGKQEDLVALVRGVAGYAGGTHKC